MIDSNSARFALWAPDAQRVDVEFTTGRRQPLPAQADGWFVGKLPCTACERYRYRLDGKLVVADPASRYQPEGVHGPSALVDPAAYRWQQPNWQGRPWHQAVIYELHVGLCGGYTRVIERLPALAELGITAIELMPIGQFPGTRNWGYDGVLPFAPQHSYGTPEQLCELVDQAHGHGLMVLLDVVYNHFGPDGNYLGQYASGFFREDRRTPWGAAIDFRRRQVREFFIENALMWLQDYRFDGLRLDAAHAIDDPDFVAELAHRVRSEIAPGRQVWLSVENEHNQAHLLEQGFDGQWNDDGHNALHVLLTGEREAYYADYSESTIDKLARCLSQGFIFQGQPDRNGRPRGEPSAHLPPTAFVLFLQNHDQIGNRAFGERLNQLCPPQALRAATTLLLLAPMIPLLFMGDEWGCEQPFVFFTDHHDELADAVREGRRAEFAGFSAFADAASRAQIADPNAVNTFNASRPLAPLTHQQPWRLFYRQLLALRERHIVPHLPGIRALGAQVLGPQALSARWQLENGGELRIDLNLGPTAAAVDLPASSARLFSCSQVSISSQQLPPYSALVSLTSIPSTEPAHD
ncbi:malto-oligosyltrehalose trehalohydrolase [Pseudomonas sp. TNT2022 ID1025]|uniref:Malto-oligosyltrehalose trehalohydrolase n=2 Tax=Pseudomonas rubra TaxID=2942627 RepID=A0ABT5PAD0_9PSED|nr:malto-oligosyltrehalose trehalohydrolase [Pseudomonas rubra]MDD1015142.1 malto-oligosyltrehalose trehalohydrolase [Pseudomonas rubra]MDD1037721.1 malto-oligosyltrehalose trehalohydrolase [Pseudomonas rubra]MDD1157359.1 malto-oligosyltrehalose trehalohydrolase [Pseudomonas rubra]